MKAAQSQDTGQDEAFASAKDRSPAPVWDRGNLKKWRKTLSKERRNADLQKLSRIFNLAAKVPELRDALEWAKNHGIDFIVDHKVKAGGYYTMGTGVVAIADKSFDNECYAAGVVVHEIRHAWQDYYGMIPTTGKSFAGYFIRLSVVEADARAHQYLTEHQYGLAHGIDNWKARAPSALQRVTLANLENRLQESRTATEALWDDFTYWYTESADWYGQHALKTFGNLLGVPGVEKPDIHAEYQPYKDRPAPKIEGIDVTRLEDLRRLGKGFKGGNYFNHAKREMLDRRILAPGRAATLFDGGADVKKQADYPRPPLADEIRKRELLLKRHKGKAVLL